jgi:hypothetical protein
VVEDLASGFFHVKAVGDKSEKSWLLGMQCAFKPFGGVPGHVVPSSFGRQRALKYFTPGAISASKDFSAFYGVRFGSPQRLKLCGGESAPFPDLWLDETLPDAGLTIGELNRAIARGLGSKSDIRVNALRLAFGSNGDGALAPLPETPFDIPEVVGRKLGDSLTVKYGKHYYSAPQGILGQRVAVKATASSILIYGRDGALIASHSRKGGKKYIIEPSHMDGNGKPRAFDGDGYRRWARCMGPHTERVIGELLARGEFEEESFRSCMAILQLSKKHSSAKLEDACRLSGDYGSDGYSAIAGILKDGPSKWRLAQMRGKLPGDNGAGAD